MYVRFHDLCNWFRKFGNLLTPAFFNEGNYHRAGEAEGPKKRRPAKAKEPGSRKPRTATANTGNARKQTSKKARQGQPNVVGDPASPRGHEDPSGPRNDHDDDEEVRKQNLNSNSNLD